MAVDEEENVVVRMIYSAAALRSETLDLGGKGICEIPKEILDLKYLESLHLEGNYITELPKDFFEKLTNLKWLDLRNNRLSALPISIGRHRTLRSLLLEGNSLTHLPCELGMVKSLCGLNLFSNPLEFPPPFIVKKGTQEILKYLREMCKKTGWTDEKSGSSDQESEMDYFNSEYKSRRLKPLTFSSDFPEPVNAPATFHPPPKRVDHLRYEYDKLRISSGGSEPLKAPLPRPRRNSLEKKPGTKKSQSHNRSQGKALLDPYTPSSASSLKEAKVTREKRLRRTASLNKKEAIQQQRIKNKMALDDWRQESRDLKQQKQYEAIRKGVTKVKIPSPFATEGSQETDGVNGTQNKVREYNKRLHTLMEINDKDLTRKVLNDRELENRIKVHMRKIQEHRDVKFNNVADEVEDAKNNLEMAHQLQEELVQRRALEYRLRAFTGDDFVPNPRYYRKNR